MTSRKNADKTDKIDFKTRLGHVRLDHMKINPLAQRNLDQSHVDNLAANFDPDVAGLLHVSERNGWYYVVDGQHRRAACIAWLGDSSQRIMCHIYEGLTSEQEAELFLTLNHQKKQGPMSRYMVALTAERPDEVDVDRIARSLGLKIGNHRQEEEIGCVTAILTTYRKQGPGALSWSMRIIRDAYGFDGFKPPIIKGLALVTNRYGDQIDETQMIAHLKRSRLPELQARARMITEGMGGGRDRGVAAAAVEFYNRGKKKKIAPWYTENV